MNKNLLAITVAGQLKWLKEAILTLQDDLDVLVIDDATPGNSIKDFCKQNIGMKLITKLKPMGLTNSWNLAYQYFKENNYDNCILSNDDVRFPKGFSEGLLKGLDKFNIVAPLTNNPGYGYDCESSPFCQDVKRFVNINPTEKNYDKVQQILHERYKSGSFRPSNFFNGFCFAFSYSIAKFAYNKQYLFNPANVNVGNEFDLAKRMKKIESYTLRGRLGICKTSYVFHWKDKTFDNFDRGGVKSGDYREQLWRTEDSKAMKIKEMPLRQYVDRLKDNKHFSFVRYGDGEWKALIKGSGSVACRMQVVNPQIQIDMIRSLTDHAAELGIVFGMQSHGLRVSGQLIPDFLQKHKLENIRWIDADVFHSASRDGLLYPLVEQLRKMKVVIIGPNLLRSLSGHIRYIKFIEVNMKNCYQDQAAIKEKILQVHNELKENVVYSFCCGPLAETLILDLHSQMPKNFLIDFGSLWDVFCGVRSRGYTANSKYTDDILRKNIGLKPAFKVFGWLDKDEAGILQRYAVEQQKESKSDLLEIGSWKGLSSVVIASLLSGDRRLWMVDHFKGSLEHQKGQRFYTSPKYTRRNKLWIYPELLENIVKCNIQDKVIILPLTSEKAARVVDEKFSLIFIDGDHSYKGISGDCGLWLPHLEKNGVIIFHDYRDDSVRRFCNELKENKDLSVVSELRNIIVFRNGGKDEI